VRPEGQQKRKSKPIPRIPKKLKTAEKAVDAEKAKPEKRKVDKRKEKAKKKKQPKLKKKKAKKTVSSSSDSSGGSSSEDSNSASGSSASSSSMEESSSSEDEGDKHRGGKKKKKEPLDFELLEELWAEEDRPAKLQKRSVIKYMSLNKLMKMKDLYEKEQAKKGLGTAVFRRDKKPKSKMFEAQKDNGVSKLHKARFLSMPSAEPRKYWKKVPTVKSQVYRHLPLQTVGIENVPEATVVKMHDRKVPIDLDMLSREVKTVHQAQMAVLAYVGVLRWLHPIDMGGFTLQVVLTEAGWGENLGKDDKIRVQLIKRFFQDCVLENSGRAVRRQPPMDYDQV
jgi:hypothetical protein